MKRWLVGLLMLFAGACDAMAGDYPPAAPIFAASFDDLEGKLVALADFKGKPLVLNFWATWCPPCRKEIPDLVEIQSLYGERGVTLIGVAVEEKTRIPEFVKDNKVNYPILVGREHGIELLQALGNRSAGLPYTVVLDRQGDIVFIKRGALTRERLEQVLLPLL